MLLPHVRVCVRLALGNSQYGIESRDTALVLYRLSWILYIGFEESNMQRTLLDEARRILKIQCFGSSLASQELDQLEGLQELRAGRPASATKLYENIVTIHKQTLPETHPSRLAWQHVLARACMANGDNRRAAEILEQVVTIEKQTLPV